MTLENLLNDFDKEKFKTLADYLESLSDAELELHFAPYLDVTRPERAQSNKEVKLTKLSNIGNNKAQQQALEKARFLANQLGFDLKI